MMNSYSCCKCGRTYKYKEYLQLHLGGCKKEDVVIVVDDDGGKSSSNTQYNAVNVSGNGSQNDHGKNSCNDPLHETTTQTKSNAKEKELVFAGVHESRDPKNLKTDDVAKYPESNLPGCQDSPVAENLQIVDESRVNRLRTSTNISPTTDSKLNLSALKSHQCLVVRRDVPQSNSTYVSTRISDESMKCNVCVRTFTIKRNFNAHTCVQPDAKSYDCKICHARFPSKRGLAIHRTSHDKKKSVANKMMRPATHQDDNPKARSVFLSKKALAEAEEESTSQHSGEGSHTYDTTKRSSVSSAIRNDLSSAKDKAHHRNADSIEQMEESCVNSYSVNIPELSANAFRVPPQGSAHSSQKDTSTSSAEYVCDDRQNRCPVCKRTFQNEGRLRSHQCIKPGVKTHDCEVCDARFLSVRGLAIHFSKLHKDTTAAKFTKRSCQLDPAAPSSLTMKRPIKVTRHTQGENKALEIVKRANVFGCNICRKVFRSKHFLQAHQAVHRALTYKKSSIKKGPYKTRHLSEPSSEQVQCESGDESFKSKSSLDVNHIKQKTPKSFRCETCHKMFSQRNRLQTHRWRSHKNKHAPDIQCDLCPGKYWCKDTLAIHRRQFHKQAGNPSCKIKPFHCNLCQQSFKSKGILKQHLNIHTKEKKFVCDICGKELTRHYDLLQHRFIVHNLSPHRCEICSEQFRRKRDLKQHLAIYHIDDDNSDNNDSKNNDNISNNSIKKNSEINTNKISYNNNNNSNDSDINKSNSINNKISNKSNTIIVENRIKNNNNESNNEKNNNYDNDYNSFSYDNNNNIDDNSYNTNNSYNSSNKKSDSNNSKNYNKKDNNNNNNNNGINYNNHITKRNTKKANQNKGSLKNTYLTPYQCNICQKRFTRYRDLKQHLPTHVEIKHAAGQASIRLKKKHVARKSSRKAQLVDGLARNDIKCDVNQKYINSKNSFNSNCSEEKSFQCRVCDKRFRRKDCLEAHEVIHSNDRPFKCGLCSKCFKRKAILLQHQSVHLDHKPFRCALCNTGFKRKDSVNQHLKKFHSTGFVKKCFTKLT